MALPMAQQRLRLRSLRTDRNLLRFIVEGRVTGKQLGTGSYGSVEEVASYFKLFCTRGRADLFI